MPVRLPPTQEQERPPLPVLQQRTLGSPVPLTTVPTIQGPLGSEMPSAEDSRILLPDLPNQVMSGEEVEEVEEARPAPSAPARGEIGAPRRGPAQEGSVATTTQGLVASQAEDLKKLRATFVMNGDSERLQFSIAAFVEGMVNAVAAAVLAHHGFRVSDFAVVLTGSGARSEFFAASDLDLMLMHGGSELLDEEQDLARDIKDVIGRILAQAPRVKRTKSAKSANEAFQLDQAVGGRMTHTVDSAIGAAMTGGSSDNMLADIQQINDSPVARSLLARFREEYEARLDAVDETGKKVAPLPESSGNGGGRNKHQGPYSARGGFVLTRIKEMRTKLATARDELGPRSTGFDVKSGLLRTPSLLARDLATFVGSRPEEGERQSVKIFLVDAVTTRMRLEAFRNAPEQLGGGHEIAEAMEWLIAGFRFGTDLRMNLHIKHGAEHDRLDARELTAHRTRIATHLDGYESALDRVADLAKQVSMLPAKMTKLNQHF